MLEEKPVAEMSLASTAPEESPWKTHSHKVACIKEKGSPTCHDANTPWHGHRKRTTGSKIVAAQMLPAFS
jgi:hypothetical protein